MLGGSGRLASGTAAGAQRRHALAGRLPLALLAADITVSGERAALAAQHRLALATRRTGDAALLDRHHSPLPVTHVFPETSVTQQWPSGEPSFSHAQQGQVRART